MQKCLSLGLFFVNDTTEYDQSQLYRGINSDFCLKNVKKHIIFLLFLFELEISCDIIVK